MPSEVKKMMEERMKETQQEKFVDHTDMYIDQFKSNFSQNESRNYVGRQSVGKPGTGRRGAVGPKNLTIKSGMMDDDDDDEEDDDLR